MQFLAPIFLAGLAAIAIPVWVHLVRQHRAPLVLFSAVRFIEASPVEQRARRRLRDLVLLALRAAAVALLCVAFARPFFASAAPRTPATMVAVDTSASMSGTERFEAARAAARAAVDAAPSDHRVGVSAFDHTGRVVLLPQSDRRAAIAAIDRLQPGFGRSRYASAITSAAEALDEAPGRVVVVTDKQSAGWAGEVQARVPPGVDVIWAPIEPPRNNVAVTSMVVRAGRVRATVVNSGREAAASAATLTARAAGGREDVALGTRAIEVAPGETQVVEFDEPVPAEGSVSVTVGDPGGVPADDARHLVLDPVRPRRVLVVTSGLDEGREAYYLRHALEAASAQAPARITVAGGAALRDGLAAALEDADVVVVLSTRGIERSGPAAIRAFRARGGGVLLVAGPTTEPGVLAEMLDAGETRAIAGAAEPQAMVLADARHPVFASLGPLAGAVGSVRITRSLFVDAERLSPLARYTSGAIALAERRRDGREGRTLMLTTDVGNAWNDLALHPAFVPLMSEMTAHVDGRRAASREYTIGEPDAPRDTPGVIEADGPQVSRVAVNVDPAESDSAIFLDSEARARIGVDDRVAARALEARREREAESPLWRYAIVAMMAALLAESVVTRRVDVGAR